MSLVDATEQAKGCVFIFVIETEGGEPQPLCVDKDGNYSWEGKMTTGFKNTLSFTDACRYMQGLREMGVIHDWKAGLPPSMMEYLDPFFGMATCSIANEIYHRNKGRKDLN